MHHAIKKFEIPIVEESSDTQILGLSQVLIKIIDFGRSHFLPKINRTLPDPNSYRNHEIIHLTETVNQRSLFDPRFY